MTPAKIVNAPVRWAVFHIISIGGKLRQRPVLVLEGVPAGTPRREVIARLEGAGAAARFETAGVAWGNHRVIPEPRWSSSVEWDGKAAERWTWQGLEAAQSTRNITLVLPPAEYASVVLAARGAGESIQAWCRRELLTAARA